MTESTSEQDVVAALRRLAQDTEMPAPDPEAERAILEAFDVVWARRRARMRSPLVLPAATAALLALAATLVWMMAGRPVRAPVPTPPPAAPLATTEFVIWPGAGELPRFESGHLMRMQFPASALPSLGLVAPASQAAVVYADVLVGQDGLPRAVRLSPDF